MKRTTFTDVELDIISVIESGGYAVTVWAAETNSTLKEMVVCRSLKRNIKYHYVTLLEAKAGFSYLFD